MKIKKMMALVTAAAMAFGLAGCGGGNTAATTAAPTEKAEGTTAAEAVTEATEAAKSEGSDNWKVAILTGTVSQGEEEFRAAEKALATFQLMMRSRDPEIVWDLLRRQVSRIPHISNRHPVLLCPRIRHQP